MAVNLSLFAGAGAQFFDNSGVILSGGLVYTYAAGTTTPQTAYTTNSGSTAHTNPIVLDSAGRVASGGEIWLTDAIAYKFVLKTSAGVTIATYDNVTGNASGIYASFAASSGSSLIGFIQNGVGAVATTVQAKLRQTVSVKDFGAVGDGTTNDTAAIQLAVNYAASSGKTLVVPAGNYLSTTGDVYLSPGINIVGEGQGITTFTLGNGATTAYFWYSGSRADPGLYQFSNFTITGSWLTSSVQNSTALIVLNFATTATPTSIVTFNNIEASYSRGFGIVTDVTARSEAINCYVHHMNRDGISFSDCQDKVFINCQVEHAADNGISGHVTNGFSQAPVTARLTMDNCRLIDTYGAAFLGVSEATISNVYCTRSKGIAFSIGTYINSPQQGWISTRQITISNLVIEDTINQSVDGTGTAAVGLQMGTYNAIGTGLPALPYRPNTVADIIPPEPYVYNLGATGNTVTVPTGAGWNVQAIIRQTLPAVTNYSDWGFGQMFGQNGFVNPAITDADLSIQGIVLYNGLRDARIQAIVEPRSVGVLISEPSTPDYLYQNVIFENCSFVRCVGNAINTDATSVDIQDIKFLNCLFDVDPRFESADRDKTSGEYNGKWKFTSTTAIVQGATYIDGIVFENCHFRNCQSLDTTQASGNPVNYLGVNYLHCKPAVIGGSSGNEGIGTVKAAGGNFAYFVEVCDPRQTGTFSNIVTVQYFDAASIPTTGTWVTGAFVRNNAPVVSASKVTLGWARLTTGSANVNGTDWSPVVATIS